MFIIGLAVIFGVPKLIDLTNRVLEDYVIPRHVLKKGAAGEVVLSPAGFDMALTTEEMAELQKMGAVDILERGIKRHHFIAMTGQADLCAHCQRLHT